MFKNRAACLLRFSGSSPAPFIFPCPCCPCPAQLGLDTQQLFLRVGLHPGRSSSWLILRIHRGRAIAACPNPVSMDSPHLSRGGKRKPLLIAAVVLKLACCVFQGIPTGYLGFSYSQLYQLLPCCFILLPQKCQYQGNLMAIDGFCPYLIMFNTS